MNTKFAAIVQSSAVCQSIKKKFSSIQFSVTVLTKIRKKVTMLEITRGNNGICHLSSFRLLRYYCCLPSCTSFQEAKCLIRECFNYRGVSMSFNSLHSFRTCSVALFVGK